MFQKFLEWVRPVVVPYVQYVMGLFFSLFTFLLAKKTVSTEF